MAELKMKDVQIHPYETDFQSNQQVVFEQTQRPEIIKVPTSPITKIAKLSRLEKWLIFFVIFGAIALGLLAISLRTQISSVENSITTIQNEIDEANTTKADLQQEKNELSKTDRIQKIAEKEGLSIKEDNLRNVK
jgi:cell division protein FtsL